MQTWQISSKRERGDQMELREFPSAWQAVLWLMRNIRGYRICVIVRIED